MGNRVLIVEDEEAIVEILKFNLQKEGYETLEALDGEAGLSLAREADPDLILLDVMLPKMNGFEVCGALRAGLALAQKKGDRFEPEHAWALASKSAAQTADFAEDDPLLLKYLQGQAIPGACRGWTLVTVNGLSLGWAKGSDGLLKNHLPNGLRRMG